MGKRKVFERQLCMVCFEAPCVCNKAKAKPKIQPPIRQTKAEPTANSTPPPSVLKKPAAPSVLGSRAPLTEPTTTRIQPGSRHKKPTQVHRHEQPSALKNESEDEALTNDRIRLLNMMGMLHPSEKSKYETVIKSVPLAPIITSTSTSTSSQPE